MTLSVWLIEWLSYIKANIWATVTMTFELWSGTELWNLILPLPQMQVQGCQATTTSSREMDIVHPGRSSLTSVPGVSHHNASANLSPSSKEKQRDRQDPKVADHRDDAHRGRSALEDARDPSVSANPSHSGPIIRCECSVCLLVTFAVPVSLLTWRMIKIVKSASNSNFRNRQGQPIPDLN